MDSLNETDTIVPSAADQKLVDYFFQLLPSPQDHHRMHGVEAGARLLEAMQAFSYISNNQLSSDHDYLCIRNAITRSGSELGILYKQLAGLAIDKILDPHDPNATAIQLRYLRWVASGRKDETSPFNSSSEAQVPFDAIGHRNVAAESDHCVVCDKPKATMKCGACLLGSGHDIASPTVYCSEPCQIRHWPTHMVPCKQIR